MPSTTPLSTRTHRPAGSLHPLQSFPGPEVAGPPGRGVPAAVAGDPEAVSAATQIALDLGMRPFEVPGDRRLYHLAAVARYGEGLHAQGPGDLLGRSLGLGIARHRRGCAPQIGHRHLGAREGLQRVQAA